VQSRFQSESWCGSFESHLLLHILENLAFRKEAIPVEDTQGKHRRIAQAATISPNSSHEQHAWVFERYNLPGVSCRRTPVSFLSQPELAVLQIDSVLCKAVSRTS
jgi:hypothetical protein